MRNLNRKHSMIGLVGCAFLLYFLFAFLPNSIVQPVFTSCEQVVWVLFDPRSTEIFFRILTGIGFLAFMSVFFFIVSYTKLYVRKKKHLYIKVPKKIVRDMIERLGIKEVVHIVQDHKPYAYCVGVRNPRMYISTGLINMSTPEEMEIILQHELYHIQHNHLIIRFIMEVFRTFFLFIPVFSDLLRHIIIRQEVEADKAAISAVGTKKPLVTILAKLIRYEKKNYAAIAPIIDSFSLGERIRSLTDEEAPGFPIITWSAFVRTSAIMIIFLLFGFLTVPEHTSEQTSRMVQVICTSYQ